MNKASQFPDRIDTNDVDSMRLHAQEFIDGKEPTKALELFKHILERFPQIPSGYIGVADVYLAQNQGKQAEAILREGINKFPSNPYLIERLGHAAYQQQHYDKALEYYRQFDEINPEVPNGILGQCRVLRWTGRVQRAWNILKEREFPNFPSLYKAKAKTAFELGNFSEAEKNIIDFLERSSHNTIHEHLFLARVYRYSKGFSQANTYLRSIIQKFDDPSLILLEIGFNLIGEEKLDEAIEINRKLVEYPHALCEAYIRLAGITGDKSWLLKAHDRFGTVEKMSQTSPFAAAVVCLAANDWQLIEQTKQYGQHGWNASGNQFIIHENHDLILHHCPRNEILGTVYINGLSGSGKTYLTDMISHIGLPVLPLILTPIPYRDLCSCGHLLSSPIHYSSMDEEFYQLKRLENDNDIAKINMVRHPIDTILSHWHFRSTDQLGENHTPLELLQNNFESFIWFAEQSPIFLRMEELLDEMEYFEESPLWFNIKLEDCHDETYRNQMLVDFFEVNSRPEAVQKVREMSASFLPPKAALFKYKKLMMQVPEFARWVNSIPQTTRLRCKKFGYEI